MLVAAIVVMFVLGDAPVERRADLDTYYAATPFIREMVLLYLAGLLTAAAATCVLCWRWAREVRGWVLAGLRLLTAGSAGIAAFALAKLAAVVARWSGRDWAELSTTVAPRAVAVAAVLSAVGYVIPLVGPRLAEGARDWCTYRRLGPLERELAPVLARRALRAPGSCGLSPAARLVCRESSIHNALAHLAPLFDRALHEHTYQAALRDTGDRGRAEATAWAAVIAAAARTALPDPTGPGSPGHGGQAAGGRRAGGGTTGRAGSEAPGRRGAPGGTEAYGADARPVLVHGGDGADRRMSAVPGGTPAGLARPAPATWPAVSRHLGAAAAPLPSDGAAPAGRAARSAGAAAAATCDPPCPPVTSRVPDSPATPSGAPASADPGTRSDGVAPSGRAMPSGTALAAAPREALPPPDAGALLRGAPALGSPPADAPAVGPVPAALVQIARALHTSPLVAAARTTTVAGTVVEGGAA